MGFYSFYKIIKDIIKTLFGSKGWKLLLLTIIVLIVLINTVYGAYTFIEYSNGEYKDLYFTRYLILRKDNGDLILIGYSQGDNFVYKKENDTNKIILNNSGRIYYYTYDNNNKGWVYDGYDMTSTYSFIGDFDVLYCSHNVLLEDNTLYFETKEYNGQDLNLTYPYIANTAEDLASGDFDYFLIFPGTIAENSSIGLEIYKVCNSNYDFNGDGTAEDYDYYELLHEMVLNGSGYEINKYDETWFEIPQSHFSFSFENDVTYVVQLVNDIDGNEIISPDTFIIYDKIQFTVGGLTAEDIEENRHNALINSTKDVEDAVKDVEDAVEGVEDAVAGVDNTIKESTDKFFDDEYDESQIEISTEASDSVDSSSITNFVTTLLRNIQNLATGDWDKVETISIPLGFVDKNIEFRSDLISAHIPTALKYLINIFWMYLFGMYIFKYSSKLIDWLKSGDILNNKEMSANEVITSSML